MDPITIGLGVAAFAVFGGAIYGKKKGWFKKKNPVAAEASGKVYNGPEAAQPTTTTTTEAPRT